MSDNGPQFTSNEFTEFMSKNGIKHTLVPPYHPQSNGAAERSVRVVKEALVKQVLEGKTNMSIKHRLANFLLRYRTTPHSTTGVTPAELLMRRRLRTRLSLVKPDLVQVVESKQNRQKKYKDFKCHKEREFEEKDAVRVRNTQSSGNADKWILGKVVKVCGPRTYLVRTGHITRYVHSDHLIRAHDEVPNDANELDLAVAQSCEQSVQAVDVNPVSDSISQSSASVSNEETECGFDQEPKSTSPPVILRRSLRIRKPVDRLNL